MRLLIHGINYAPEMVGIAKYTTEMAEWLASRGHDVSVVTAPPYYPYWDVPEDYRRGRQKHTTVNGVKIRRSRIYVPANPTGPRRVLHHLSWGLGSFATLLQTCWTVRPDLVLSVAPSLLGAPGARVAAGLCGARSWIHIQDFEIEAAVAANMLSAGPLTKFALWAEGLLIRSFDEVSTISPEMAQLASRRGIKADHLFELLNWVDTSAIRPLPRTDNPYRAAWGLSDNDVLCLYSGTLSHKQSLNTVIEAARRMNAQQSITFAICGEGPMKQALIDQAQGLNNIRFETLQPADQMANLLSAADLHLLPQIPEATDLVLPSKLAPMLASGRPVIATVDPGTGIAREIEGCGSIVAPRAPEALADAIVHYAQNPALRREKGMAARHRAMERWSKDQVLGNLEARLIEAIRPAAKTPPLPAPQHGTERVR